MGFVFLAHCLMIGSARGAVPLVEPITCDHLPTAGFCQGPKSKEFSASVRK